jgi:hypothetical protein
MFYGEKLSQQHVMEKTIQQQFVMEKTTQQHEWKNHSTAYNGKPIQL